MPLRKGTSRKTVSKNIAEFHTGKTYARTRAKFGKATADRQAIAASLDEQRKSNRKGKPMAKKETKAKERKADKKEDRKKAMKKTAKKKMAKKTAKRK